MITRFSDSNFGRIVSLEYLYNNQVESRYKDESDFSDNITPTSGNEFKSIYFTPESCEVKANNEETKAGDKYSYQVIFRVPKNRQTIEQTIASLKLNDFILKITDGNGISRTMDVTRVYTKMLKSSSADQYPGYELTLVSDMVHPALYI